MSSASFQAVSSGSGSASRSGTPMGHRRSAHISGLGASTPTRSDSMPLSPNTPAGAPAIAGVAASRPQLHAHDLHLVQSEITTVTSVMRKATRWTTTSYNALQALKTYSYSSASAPSSSAGASATTTTLAAANSGARAASGPRSSLTIGVSADSALRSGSDLKGKSVAVDAGAADTTVDPAGRRLGFSFAAAGKPEDPVSLLSGFVALRAQLRTCRDFSSFPLPELLSPFLRVILSPRTSAPITSAALQAVHKFLVYGLIRPSAPGAQLAVAEIAHATSHCRFEASEATTDELVLIRILAVMRELICEPADLAPFQQAQHYSAGISLDADAANGVSLPRAQALADCLGDDSICEMMETGLSMCSQTRLSEVLRRTAEQSMTAMLRSLFTRLSSLPTTVDEFFSTQPGAPEHEPEHATLAADPVGQDAETDDKKLRRMTMPDPTSNAFPAAAAQALQELKEIGEEEERQEQEESERSVDAENTQGESTTTPPVAGATSEAAVIAVEDAVSTPVQPGQSDLAASLHAGGEEDEAVDPQSSMYAPLDVEPYGLPAVREVLRVVISLLDPSNLQQTDTMRRLGISMLTAILECSGRSVARFPSLRVLVQDSACKHLFTLAQSENTLMLSLSLRCISVLFETMREHLKLQHELYLTFLMDRLAPTFPLSAEPWNDRTFDSISKRAAAAVAAVAALGPSTDISRAGTPDSHHQHGTGAPTATGLSSTSANAPAPPASPLPKTSDNSAATGEARELLLDALALLFRNFDVERSSEYLVDLYVNYDCDIDCEDMFERVIHFLCRSIHASNPQHPNQQDSLQLFALDALLSFVTFMAERQENMPAAGAAGFDTASRSVTLSGELSFATLSQQKGKKATILAGAARFNAKPKDGLAYLEQEGLLDYPDKPDWTREHRIAKFLKDCPRLDKKLLGDYLGRPDNVKVLEAFVKLFDFKDKPIAEALRELLESFRLPGESQQIERITQIFAATFFAAKPDGIATEDAVFILSYSVIMLNTDLHNPQNKRRMMVEDYRKNLRGVNDGKDFDPELTGAIYESIRKREIVMPEEHAGQLGFEYTWKELLRRSRTAGSLVSCDTSAFDRSMFEATWKPIFSSIAYAFSTFRDEYMVERAISGIRQSGILASSFDMIEVFDFMVHSLASATGLLDASVPQTFNTNPTVIEVENQQITVSPLSTRFGVNFKGQLAAVVLFTIANGNVNAIRTGWSDLFEIFKNLFANGMLPDSMMQMEDLADGVVPIPMKPKKIPGPSPQDPRAQGGGLFSTLSSYLLSPYSSSSEPAPYEATEQDIEATLSSVDCIASCRIEELWDQILQLDTESHLCAVQHLRFHIEALTVDRVAFRDSQRGSKDGTLTPNYPNSSIRDAHPNSSTNSRNGSSTNLVAGAGATGAAAAGLPMSYDPRVAFLLELLAGIVVSSPALLFSETWPWLSEHVSNVLRNARAYHHLTVEREVAVLLRVIALAADREALRDQIFVALDLLRTLPVEIRISGSKQLLAGLERILAGHPGFVRSSTEWGLIFALIADNSNMRNADSARLAFQATRAALVGNDADSQDQPGKRLTTENFMPAVTQLVDFANGADTSAWRNMILRETPQRRTTLTEKKEMEDAEKVQQERGLEAVALLEGLKVSIPRLVATELERRRAQSGSDEDASAEETRVEEVWTKYWFTLLGGLARQWVNAHAGVRGSAVPLLQRALFSPELVAEPMPTSSVLIRVVFNSTLFPLMEELLKPQVYALDPPSAANKNTGMLEVRIRASALICKTFLHLMPYLMPRAANGNNNAGEEEAFKTLWLEILDLMDRMINSTGGNAGRRNPLTEAIPENLKNVLLVMSTSSLLAPASAAATNTEASEVESRIETEDSRSPLQRSLFEMTTDRLHRFLPGLVEEVFPPPPASATAPTAAQTPVPAEAPIPDPSASEIEPETSS
ncbi:hypothetical protein BCV70DRAFT_197407 [Testicularia cyperi]|uniref:SEC7 domain-containing protein n=1 Tax=Testicularia cyperi TaxID=1882483 RepID=A0A317Y0L0_9BASI|nr:hypothetical protein BCV70DRAFT_197407 [Testicularia cyperi]